MFNYETLSFTVHANQQKPDETTIGLITLNRPEALNAIDVQMRVELDILLDQIRRDDSIRVVIITGEGRGFSAGGDLRSEAGPLGALDADHDFGNFGAYRLLANYFFNDLRHVVIQRAIRKLEELRAGHHRGDQRARGRHRARARDRLRHALRLGSRAARRGRRARGLRSRNRAAHAICRSSSASGRAMEMILTGEIVDAHGSRAHRPRRARLSARHAARRGVQDRKPDRVRARSCRCGTPRRWCAATGTHNKSEESARAELEAVMEITRTADCREGIAPSSTSGRPSIAGRLSRFGK